MKVTQMSIDIQYPEGYDFKSVYQKIVHAIESDSRLLVLDGGDPPWLEDMTDQYVDQGFNFDE